MNKGKKTYLNLGSIIEKRDKQTGEPILDANNKKTYYLKIDKNSEVVINGVKVEGYISVNRPRDKYDRKLQKGTMTKAQHAEKIAQYEADGDYDYVTFELSASVED